jgi:hypothetical protein
LADVPPPFDYLDFHEGKAELKIGGISYDPGITSIVRYHGEEFLSVSPSVDASNAGISATFLDDEGNDTLKIVDNVWTGAVGAWDTEVVGPRIKVRKKRGIFSLILRLEPPGRIVVEKLDMRVLDAHILASENTYALGRYNNNNGIHWFHANMVHMGAPMPGASAIEFLTSFEVEWRDQQWNGRGQRLASADNQIVTQTGLGVASKRMGIIVGANCLKFGLGTFSGGGPRPIEIMRSMVFTKPERVAQYIGAGR